jgi:large subunit ribosomal protein L24
MSLKIKKGDTVEVISGKHKFDAKEKKRGKVRKVIRNKQGGSVKLIVENINMAYKHMKPSQMNPKGGRIEKESPIAADKTMLVCPSCDATTRIKVRDNAKGARVRYCMRCDKDIDTGS